MQDLIDYIGTNKGWTLEQKLEAACAFVDQMSEGETDAEIFLENYQPEIE